MGGHTGRHARVERQAGKQPNSVGGQTDKKAERKAYTNKRTEKGGGGGRLHLIEARDRDEGNKGGCF